MDPETTKRVHTVEELEVMETLCTGQADDLKIETDAERVWLCRVTGAISHEEYDGSRWTVTRVY